MNLLVGLYTEKNVKRYEEIRFCLTQNLTLDCLEKVIVLLEDETAVDMFPLNHPKVVLISLHRRMTYQDAFLVANQGGNSGAYVLANNDIAFDWSLAFGATVEPGEFWCLSRTEDSGQLYEPTPGRPDYSQDAWIFRAPLPLFRCDWHLGKPGCENRIAYEALSVGLSLRNPARKIRAFHRHASNVRHATEADRMLDGPYRFVRPE